MEGRSGRGAAAAALLAAAAAAAGCCGLTGGRTVGNRDTPEAAFEFVRAAFAEDRTRDQLDSLHRMFQARQGINASRYEIARGLRPGLFEKAARVLGGATLESVEYARIETRKEPSDPPRPRDAARVSVATPGGRGVFILVDEPAWRLWTVEANGALVPHSGPLLDIGKVVAVRDGQVVVDFRGPMPFAPEEAPRVLRLEIHHDWLVFDVESLEGFEEFLGQVRETADRADREPAVKEEAPK